MPSATPSRTTPVRTEADDRHLGRVVAVAHALGPERGLQLLDEQDGLGSDDLTAQRFHAVRDHLLRQVGETPAAAEHFRAAAGLTLQRSGAGVPAGAGGMGRCRPRLTVRPPGDVRRPGTTGLRKVSAAQLRHASLPGANRRADAPAGSS